MIDTHEHNNSGHDQPSIESRLDTLGGFDRAGAPEGMARRIADASLPSLYAPPVVARIGAGSPGAWSGRSIHRFGALAAMLALFVGAAALFVSVRPGPEAFEPAPAITTVAADLDLWMSLEAVLNDPVDDRLNFLYAESTALETYDDADLFTLEILSALESM